MFSPWRIELFGGLRIHCGRNIVTRLDTRKTVALIGFLACYLRRRHPREALAELLWPDEDPEATRPRLRQALFVIRRALQHSEHPNGIPLTSDHLEVRLDPMLVTTDVDEFESLLEQVKGTRDSANRLRLLLQATNVYQGELLPGFYEEWILTERSRLQEAYVGALLDLSAALEVAGDRERALTVARRAAQADPLRESAHCALMQLYALAGRKSDAIRQYRTLERVLLEEFDEAPSPAVQRLFARLDEIAKEPPPPPIEAPAPVTVTLRSRDAALEPVGGAVPLASAMYVVRPVDGDLRTAIMGGDSIVLIKGPRQVGKTSLLARGLQAARLAGFRVAQADLQKLSIEQISTTERFFRTLAELMVDELELDVDVASVWNGDRGWNVNFERFLKRTVLPASEEPLVWALDEVDRLFSLPFNSEVFGFFRSWHNARSLDPAAPWSRLTLAIAYATEAHLFITDLNQSPFNVGTRLTLEDFTEDQVAELNRRAGSPLQGTVELEGYLRLVGGHPYLVRRGLYEMVRACWSFGKLEREAAREDGPFGDHLRRLRHSLAQDLTLTGALQELLCRGIPPSPDSFFRLRSAGVLSGQAPDEARARCGLYHQYFMRHVSR